MLKKEAEKNIGKKMKKKAEKCGLFPIKTIPLQIT